MRQAMDKSYIDRHLVVDRYVSGDLTANEREDFEERLAWDDELVDEVDLAERLRDGMRQAGEKSSAERRPAGRRLFQLPLAAAASFAAGLAASSLFLGQQAAVVQTDDQQYSTSVVALDVMRGTARQQIAVNPRSFVVFMISVDPGYQSYRVEVIRPGEPEPVWVQDDMVPGYSQSLAIGIPGSRLQAGHFVATVFADTGDATSPVREIPFEVFVTPEE